MQAISLKNFKSYPSLSFSSLNFNPYLNIFLGGNGQGKSNIFKAISFVLSDKVGIGRSQWNNYFHKGAGQRQGARQGQNGGKPDKQEIQVQVLMGNPREGVRKDGETVRIGKVWKDELVEECFINGKFTNKKQYQNLIQSLRLSYSNPYNIIQQGKITQITLMDQFEIYSLLQQVTGLKKFSKRITESLSLLAKLSTQKQECQQILSDLNGKLSSLESRKQQFQLFTIQEKTKKYRDRKYLKDILQGMGEKKSYVQEEFMMLCQKIQRIDNERSKILREMEQAQVQIKLAKGKIFAIQNAGSTFQSNIQTVQSQQIRQQQKRQKQLQKQLSQIQKKINQKDKIITTFKQNFSSIQFSFQQLKLSLQLSSSSSSPVLSNLNSQLSSLQSSLSSLQSQLPPLNSLLSPSLSSLSSRSTTSFLSQFNSQTQSLSSLSVSLQTISKQLLALKFQQNIQNIGKQQMFILYQEMVNNMRKMGINYGIMDWLEKQGKREGVYGFFGEFVGIEEGVRFGYQAIGLGKLGAILVEGEQGCRKVIEANRVMRGKQVNIIQLDLIRRNAIQSYSVPKSQSVHKLSNPKWIKPSIPSSYSSSSYSFPPTFLSDIQKLILSNFSSYALVKDYQTALTISKEYHITCITSLQEIVYADGYHCKLGYNGRQRGKDKGSVLQNWQKMLKRKQEYEIKVRQLDQLREKIQHLANQQIKALNLVRQKEAQLGKMKDKYNAIMSQKKMVEMYQRNIQAIEKNCRQLQLNIQKKKETIKILTQKPSKSKFKFSKTQSEKIQQQYHKNRRELSKMLTQIFALEQEFQTLSTEKQALDSTIVNLKNSLPSHSSHSSQLLDFSLSPAVLSHKLGIFVEQKLHVIHKLQLKLQQINKNYEEFQTNRNHSQMKLMAIRVEVDDVKQKLEEIGDIGEGQEEQMEELSNSISMSISRMGLGRKKHFSARDRVLFNKFVGIFQSFEGYKKNFKDLQQAEDKIRKKINQYEQESQEYLIRIAEKFEKQFIDIFTFIVNNGSAQVRCKKVSQKIKQAIRYKSCLMIKVSFSSSSQPLKKWTDFSGGQKTVIAISIILALQRCQPAPFYILDEIDSALDPIYIQKIAQLLAKETQRNNSQYFVSTFKQDMINFPEQICNYYLVTCDNRVSGVEKIRQNKTLDVLRSLSMRR